MREAILSANATGGAHTLTCTNIAGTIALASALPPITGNATIAGPGRDLLTVSGSNNFRVFEVAPGGINTFRDLTIANGFATNGGGGGVLNNGNLALVNCSIVSNKTVLAPGGGIANHGTLTVTSCLIAWNSSFGSFYHHSFADAKAGGIYTGSGTVVVSNSTLLGNTVVGGVGPFVGISIPSGLGGGAFVEAGAMILLHSTIVSNLAGGGFRTSIGSTAGTPGGSALGGGIYLSRGTLRFTNCTISLNRATGLGGTYSGPGGSAYGGGIFAIETVDLVNCTFFGNSSRGGAGGEAIDYNGGGGGAGYGAGIYATGTVSLVNCTISGNTAQGGSGGNSLQGWGGSGGSAGGGGVYARTGNLSFVNDTLFQNVASGGARGTGPIANGFPGNGFGFGIYGTSNSVALKNTILQAGSGAFRSGGYNLLEALSSLNASDIVVTQLTLGPLQNNGGPTLTHALPSDSPAIDTGTTIGAPAFDQRGLPRPRGWGVDIGAFEVQQPKGPLLRGALRADGFRLTLTGDIGSRYQIDAATLLGNWATLTVVSNSSGTVLFTDSAATNRAQRFYRAQVVP